MSDTAVLEAATPIIPAGEDLDKALAFYEQLGFTRIWREGEMAGVRRDAVEIVLFRREDKHLAEWTSFRIRVSDVAALYEEFQAKGEPFIHSNGKLETKPWGSTEFAIVDIAGVCLTFFQRGSGG